MEFRGPTWKTWTVLLLCAGIYGVLGYWLSSNDTVEAWIYRIGLTAAAVIPVCFVLIYTSFGLFSSKSGAKWWKTDLGTATVIAALSIFPMAGPLAWVFWFKGGMLTSTWLAWLAVSGPCVCGLAWLRVCLLWVRIRRNYTGK